MRELTLTQEYFLCMMRKKGGTAADLAFEGQVCLVAGVLYELLLGGVVAQDEKKRLTVKRALTPELVACAPVYDLLREKPLRAEKLCELYVFSTGKRIKELAEVLARAMPDAAEVREKRGLFGRKTVFFPRAEAVDRVVEKLRAEFLEEGELSDETAFLGEMLKASGVLKRYFSRYESERVKTRLKELKASGRGELVQKMVCHVETLIAMTASVAAGSN